MRHKTQLVLKTSDLSNLGYTTVANTAPTERTADYNGTNGYVNRRQSVMTWKNINLRDILGELYETDTNYDLELVNITFFVTSNLSTFSPNESDRALNIYLSGPPNIISYSSIGMNQEVLLTSLRLPTGNYTNTYNFSNNISSFKINTNQFCDFTITYRNLLNNNIQPQSTGATIDYPYAQFTFNISKKD
jgi:hypothetical protein